MYETRAKAQRSEALTGRFLGRRGLAHVLRVFSRSNKENAVVAPVLPAKVNDGSFHTVRHIQPGVELYPSVMNLSEFIGELHCSSDRYSGTEQLQKSPAPIFPDRSPSIALSTKTLRPNVELPLCVDRERFGRIVQESDSRENAAKATEDLRNLLREIYMADDEGEASGMELPEEPSTSRSRRHPAIEMANAVRRTTDLREFPQERYQPLPRFLSQFNRWNFETCLS